MLGTSLLSSISWVGTSSGTGIAAHNGTCRGLERDSRVRRWILTVEEEDQYNDASNIKVKFRKAAQIPDEDIVVVTLKMSVTLIETDEG